MVCHYSRKQSDNKKELYHLVANHIYLIQVENKIVMGTYDTELMYSTPINDEIIMLTPCTHEEADTRVMLHVLHSVRQGFNMDVVVPAVASVNDLKTVKRISM